MIYLPINRWVSGPFMLLGILEQLILTFWAFFLFTFHQFRTDYFFLLMIILWFFFVYFLFLTALYVNSNLEGSIFNFLTAFITQDDLLSRIFVCYKALIILNLPVNIFLHISISVYWSTFWLKLLSFKIFLDQVHF